MKGANSKKITIVCVLAIIIVVIIIISFLIPEEKEEQRKLTYTIEVESSGPNHSWEVSIPYPIGWDFIHNDIKQISGEIVINETQIEDQPYLIITGTGNAFIRFYKEFKAKNFIDFSWAQNENSTATIYASVNNETLNLFVEYFYSYDLGDISGVEKFRIEGPIDKDGVQYLSMYGITS